MITKSGLTPINIEDKEFLITSTIDRCPKTMMIRELMMNAIEAARLAPAGGRFVLFHVKYVAGHPKLAILNTGPGMDGRELYSMCDLASSIGKQKGLDQNFGMGAKVASLPSNTEGLRYRSCKNGTVHEVILCKRDGVYGRLRRKSVDGTLSEVIDVTEVALKEGAKVDFDWTEVTLVGNSLSQKTAEDPYNGDPACDDQWLATYLYHRFYRFPDEVRVELLSGTHKLGAGKRAFKTIPDRILAGIFEKNETITTPEGIKIHYIYDAPYEKSPGHNRSISGAIQSALSTCAVVFKNELYDLRKSKAWAVAAPMFGIPFGARHISIHVELPDNYAVRPEGYRRFLQYVAGEQHQVAVTDFCSLVIQYRPQWMLDIIKALTPDSQSNDDIRNELQKLLDELRVLRSTPRLREAGLLEVKSGDRVGVRITGQSSDMDSEADSQDQEHIDLSIAPEGSRRADIWKNRERAPEIIPLYTDQEIEEKQIKERAGRYYESGQLFINMKYPSVASMQDDLEREYADAPDIEQMRAEALRIARQTIMLRVGRAVVYALAKQANKEWDAEHVRKAYEPESLSLAADDYRDSLQTARRRLGRIFRTQDSGRSNESVTIN